MDILDLKNELGKRSQYLHQWAIQEVDIERDESYLVERNKVVALEQSRNVRKKEVNVKVWVPKENGRLGFFSQNIKLDEKIGQIIEMMIQIIQKEVKV